MAKEYDPLSAIPSAEFLRKRIDELDESRRKLKVLLTTATDIENRQSDYADQVSTHRELAIRIAEAACGVVSDPVANGSEPMTRQDVYDVLMKLADRLCPPAYRNR